MDNLCRLQSIYPNLILKKVLNLPENLHGATYIVNEKEKDGESLFLASVITTQCNQSLKDSLDLTKIFIKNCSDANFMNKLSNLNSLLEVELDMINIEKKIRESVKKQMEKNQKDYYLNEQIKAIQKELNNVEDVKDEIK